MSLSRRSTTLKARQAVNYAVNRNTPVELPGRVIGSRGDPPLLPPNFPATSGTALHHRTADGAIGPTLPGARKLVDESGTKGMPVTIHSPRYSASCRQRHFQPVLDQLGYEVTLHPMPDADPTWEFLPNLTTTCSPKWLAGPRTSHLLPTSTTHSWRAGAVNNLSEVLQPRAGPARCLGHRFDGHRPGCRALRA